MDGRPTSDADPWFYRPCRYCGQRIETAFDRYGRRNPEGSFCRRECADAVHGFDNRIESERRHKTVSFDMALHDGPCASTKTPAEVLMEAEEEGEAAAPATRRIKLPSVAEILGVAEEIDPRLPGILAGLEKGKTQREVAVRIGMSVRQIRRVLSKLKATLSA